MRHLWGLDMVKTMPQLKPLVDARTKEFADIAKKYPNWKEEMEQANQAAFQAYLQQKQQEHERLMKSLDRMYDSVVFSGKMRQLSSLVTNAPSGSTVNVTIHP